MKSALLLVAVAAVLGSSAIVAQAPPAPSSYLIKTLSPDIYPQAIAIGPAGEIYIASAKGRIFRSEDGETFTVVAGREHPPTLCCIDPSYHAPMYSGDGGPALEAYLDNSQGLVVTNDGTIYFADTYNHRIRRISKNGIIDSVAGTGDAGFSGDGGTAVGARLNSPHGLALDKQGNLYVADRGNHRIRMISRTGMIVTVVGTGKPGFSGDGGAARKAKLMYPGAVSVDDSGAIYISDTRNYRLRKVDASGVIRTIAGSGKSGRGVADGPAVKAALFSPGSLAATPDGALYFTDLINGVRRVSPDGTIQTVGGNGQVQGGRRFLGDGGPATQTPLHSTTLALLQNGEILIDDQASLRKLIPLR